jgi:hypothetical protein
MSPAPIPVVKPGDKMPPFSKLKAMFAYDTSEPLDYKDLGENDWLHTNVEGVYSAREITYMSAGREVHGYLVLPEGEGPFPVVLYGIDRPGDYDAPYMQAAAFASKGYAGLLVDAPAALDLPGYYTWDAPQDVATWVASVTDLRRGLDVLETLPKIDAGRIGFLGNTYGGAMGADLAGLDERIQAYALVMVGGYLSTLGSWDTRPGGEQFFAAQGGPPPKGAALRGYEAQMAVIDPVHYIGHSRGATFLLLNAPHEWPAVWREELDALIAATPKPQTARWFDKDVPASGRTLDGPGEAEYQSMYAWLEQNL